ncbi:MAG: cyclodeaminase/cyclohydrolase family protein [Thermoplasmatota archaeon]|nr:cyclodeaminase/cyclohydrolase family protein [Candidatus Thermoplasmatota archaeon]MBU1914370.1 cyclodeaminase/cyclohydrolase family protein [Candidatus Thermoplasmatota archaeon]
MKDFEALRKFCLELSSDMPSPGGGTAAAAAGGMAASLLAMVCAITAKNKKHEARKPELERLQASLVALRDDLISQAREDADSYDKVVLASRARRKDENPKTVEDFQRALRHACSVPLETASACADVLEKSARVAELGTVSASSDVGVAVLLAETGFKGAAMNVNINLAGISDAPFARHAREMLKKDEKRAKDHVRDALSRLTGIGGN